jgi:hypothetical protein
MPRILCNINLINLKTKKLINPIGIGILVGVGIGYGIYRLSAGEKADIWINKNFGFRP